MTTRKAPTDGFPPGSEISALKADQSHSIPMNGRLAATMQPMIWPRHISLSAIFHALLTARSSQLSGWAEPVAEPGAVLSEVDLAHFRDLLIKTLRIVHAFGVMVGR
jgi:hypothetical protein